METASLEQAVARIGSAVARLERALDRSALLSPGGNDPALAARHAALREQVGAALADIDRLVESLER